MEAEKAAARQSLANEQSLRQAQEAQHTAALAAAEQRMTVAQQGMIMSKTQPLPKVRWVPSTRACKPRACVRVFSVCVCVSADARALQALLVVLAHQKTEADTRAAQSAAALDAMRQAARVTGTELEAARLQLQSLQQSYADTQVVAKRAAKQCQVATFRCVWTYFCTQNARLYRSLVSRGDQMSWWTVLWYEGTSCILALCSCRYTLVKRTRANSHAATRQLRLAVKRLQQEAKQRVTAVQAAEAALQQEKTKSATSAASLQALQSKLARAETLVTKLEERRYGLLPCHMLKQQQTGQTDLSLCLTCSCVCLCVCVCVCVSVCVGRVWRQISVL